MEVGIILFLALNHEKKMHFRRGIIFLDVSFFQHQRGDVKSGLPKQEPVDTCVTREKHVCLCYRADCIMSTVPPPSTTQTEH